MPRDHTKLLAFGLARALVPRVYAITRDLPVSERYGLQSQMRRAAVSVVTNIVEGCSRESKREFLHFLAIATGSALELRVLLDIAREMAFIQGDDTLDSDTEGCVRCLKALRAGLLALPAR